MDATNSKSNKSFNPLGQMPSYHDQVESICQSTKMMTDFMKKVQDMQMHYLNEVVESTTTMIGKMMSMHHNSQSSSSSNVTNYSDYIGQHLKKTMDHSRNSIKILKSNHAKVQSFWESKFKPH